MNFKKPKDIAADAWNGFWDWTTFPWPDMRDAAKDIARSKSTYWIIIFGSQIITLLALLIDSQIDLNNALAELARSETNGNNR